jgi:hypothetical protein
MDQYRAGDLYDLVSVEGFDEENSKTQTTQETQKALRNSVSNKGSTPKRLRPSRLLRLLRFSLFILAVSLSIVRFRTQYNAAVALRPLP